MIIITAYKKEISYLTEHVPFSCKPTDEMKKGKMAVLWSRMAE